MVDAGMMPVTLNDASAHLKLHGESYVRLVSEMKNQFRGLMQSTAGRGAICEVYSRSNKQYGEEFKEDWKIVNKVNKIRKGYNEVVDGKVVRHKADPTFGVKDLWDIVGISVICVYPSQISGIVAPFIDRKVKRGEITKIRETKHQDRGYVAHHYVLGLPALHELKCEVQVKTMLHDVWNAKTHDLIYKPEGDVPKLIKGTMDSMSSLLTEADIISEQVREFLMQEWNFDAENRKKSRSALLFDLLDNAQLSSNSECKVLKDIVSDLRKNDKRLLESEFDSPRLQKMKRRIDKFGRETNYGNEACQIVTAFAMNRPEHDLDDLALHWVDQLVDRARTDCEKVSGLCLKGIALNSLGRLDDACEVTLHGLAIARSCDMKRWLVTLNGNIAYFFTEMAGTYAGQRREALTQARVHIAEAEAAHKACVYPSEDAKRHAEARLVDTKGAERISFGSESEIDEGLKLCRKAVLLLSKDPKDQGILVVARQYFSMHKRKAEFRMTRMA